MTVGTTEDNIGFPRDAARLAMRYLLEGGNLHEKYWEHRDTNECLLPAHPFGLDTELAPVDGLDKETYDRRIRLIAFPGHTDRSVDAMRLMLLKDALSQYVSSSKNPSRETQSIRLRIVRAEVSRGHMVYFELITVMGTFICGGCTDFSGEAGRGREELETMFAFVAALHGIEVEDVTIPRSQAGGVYEQLRSAYNDFQKRRR